MTYDVKQSILLTDVTQIHWDSSQKKSSIFPFQSDYYWHFLSQELFATGIYEPT